MRKIIKYAVGSDYQESDGGSIDIYSIYSKNFVDSINIQADKARWSSDYINEIFMYFFLKIKENTEVMRKGGFEKMVVQPFRPNWTILVASSKAAGLQVCSKATVAYHIFNIILLIYSFTVVFTSSFILPLWVIITRKRKEQPYFDLVSVIHGSASYEKMEFLEETSQAKFYFDDIFQRNSSSSSMYSHGNVFQRILFLIVMPYITIRDYFLIIQDSKNLLGWQHIGFVLSYFCIRVAHKCTFEYFLNMILEKNKHVVYYTGNKEDRFSVLETRLCKKHGLKSVCIPHGIEYSIRVPAGLAGDIFYCTTPYAQKHLSNLYGDDGKFIYDKNIVKKMFSRGQSVADIDQIVFFPESREPAINLSIMKKLVESGFSILVKLHTKDSPENYKEYSDRFSYVKDFDFAISNKICLARKSTVLVEAIYNNSISIAVLTDSKDRAYVEYMFPSLKDSQIKRVYTFEELVKQLHEIKNNIASGKSHTFSQEVD